jgi:hypothetical protein
MPRDPKSPRRRTPAPLLDPSGMIADEITFKQPESLLDKKHRIWKDKRSFWVNDIFPSIVAMLIVIGLVIYGFWSLFQVGLSKEKEQFGISILTSTGTMIVGFVYGKSKK